MSDVTHEDLKKVRTAIRSFQEEEARLAAELGEPVGRSIDQEISADEQDAATFDRMTPSERMELYRTKPERWDLLIKAKEAVGMRRLFESS